MLTYSQSVTVFPIVFAAVMGHTTRIFATWKLQKGAHLGTVELLLGSSTFFSTFRTPWMMRSANWLSLVLILIWVLSPLGGQSSLHILRISTKAIQGNAKMLYFDATQTSLLNEGADFKGVLPTLNAVYLTSLLAGPEVKNSTMDLWSNVKIPTISRLHVNVSGWAPVQAANASYNSLVGIPITGLPKDGNSTFNLETSYFDLDCFNLTEGKPVPLQAPAPGFHGHSTDIITGNGTQWFGSNGSSQCDDSCLLSYSFSMNQYSPQPYGDPTVYGNTTSNGVINDSNPILLFQSRYWEAEEASSSIAQCHIAQVYVEAAVECRTEVTSEHNCSVTAVRDSQNPHPPSNRPQMLFFAFMSEFGGSLATVSAEGHEASNTPTEQFLYNPDTPLIVSQFDIPLFKLPLDVFTQRLQQVLNTYYLASINPASFSGQFEDTPAKNLTTTASVMQLRDIYVCNWGWLFLYVLAVVVMFLAAVVGVILSHLTVNPDVLGYASTMTRDNAWVKLPGGVAGTTLDGLERTRLLRHLEVRFGDVRSHDGEAGHLALSSGGLAGRSSERRFYD